MRAIVWPLTPKIQVATTRVFVISHTIYCVSSNSPLVRSLTPVISCAA